MVTPNDGSRYGDGRSDDLIETDGNDLLLPADAIVSERVDRL